MMKKNLSSVLLLPAVACSLFSCSHDKNKAVKVAGADSVAVYTIPDPAPVDPKEAAAIRASAELFYDTMLKNTGFNGGMIVAKNGTVIFEKYKGSVNLDGKDSINANTPMHIASVSKTFTAMAILKLQEQGKLSIDDLFSKYYPEFNYPGITIKTLLDHRSGLPKYEYFMEKQGWNKDSVIQNKDMLQWLIQKKDLIEGTGTPDKNFAYCNTNYALLALVIEKVTGKPFPVYMQQEIFDPLGLKNTFVHYTGDHRTVAKSFEWNSKEYGDNFLDGVYGDKNVYTTPRDLLRWDRALSDTVFLSAKSLQSSYEPYSNEKKGIRNYGFGWHMEIYPDGKKIIFHNGWWHGNNAAFVRLLKDNAVIILINNRFTRNVYKAKLLANAFEHYFDATDTAEETESQASEKDTAGVKKVVTANHKKRRK